MFINKLLTAFLIMASLFAFISCEDDTKDAIDQTTSIIPEKFKVDIPGSLSKEFKSAEFKGANGDTLQGNDIYGLLNLFIAVGEGAADLVQEIMIAIKVYNIENVTDITFTSDEDGRLKHLVVATDVEYSGSVWEYTLTVTDVLSESNEDGGIGMQVFWSNEPVEGIAIIKPANGNFEDKSEHADALYKVIYSAKGNTTYDEFMEVEISGLPLSATDPFSINNLKMYAGKKGDIVDVYGNSNHPNAQFNAHDSTAKGFNWAFVASSDEMKDIAVAELGLPASNADISGRKAILEDNSVKTVITREITNAIMVEHPGVTQEQVETYIGPYLKNTEPPGYFNSQGFVQAATSPGSDYDVIEARIESLVPFNPSTINALAVSFMR